MTFDLSKLIGARVEGRRAKRLDSTRLKELVRWSYQHPGQPIGIPTGFKDLDYILSGLQESKLYVVAGATSMGKSALAQKMTYNVACQGKRVLYISGEMDETELLSRWASMHCGIGKKAIESGVTFVNGQPVDLTREDYIRYAQAADEVKELPIYVYDQSATVEDMYYLISDMIEQGEGPDLVVDDYLQLHTDSYGGDNEVSQLNLVSKGLKILNMYFGMPFIVCSQLSRNVEMRQDRRPVLADLKGSSSIEQDANVVLLMFRADYYAPDDKHKERGKTECNIAKHRGGPLGRCYLHFHADTISFTEWGN